MIALTDDDRLDVISAAIPVRLVLEVVQADLTRRPAITDAELCAGRLEALLDVRIRQPAGVDPKQRDGEVG